MTLVHVAVVATLAAASPLLGRLVPRGVVPVVVLEILLGLLVGPAVFGWISVDAALDTLALLGVAFLFFLAGLEVDLRALRGRLLARATLAFAVGLAIALGCATVLGRVGLVQAPWLVGVAFSATGLGLVIPILRNAGLLHTERGRALVAGASVAEFAAVVVLALSSSAESSQLTSLLLLALLATAAVVVTVVGRRLKAVRPVSAAVGGLTGGTAQLRVRLSVALVIVFAALAQFAGLEVVLGAFFAGGILNVLDGDAMADPALRQRLDGIGYGFLIPVFFIVSGARLDFSALGSGGTAVLLVLLLVLTGLLARGVAALVYRRGRVDGETGATALLFATSLPFVVTAGQVGVAAGRLSPATAAAMTTAALVGVCVLPGAGVALLRRAPEPTAPEPASRTDG
jgi:Kef-type K+ transport system membrane component KefB